MENALREPPIENRERPLEIVHASPVDRSTYFRTRTVAHPKMLDILRPLWSCIDGRVSNLLVFVIGAAGVGKSKLCQFIRELFVAAHIEEMNANRGWLPIVLNVLDEKSERYSWRECYGSGLEALQEPLIQFKIMPRVFNKNYTPTGKATVDRWGNAYCEALTQRGTIASIFDNANMLQAIPKNKEKKDTVTNPFIGLREITSHYLFGTYDLFELRNKNGQIARRSKVLHYSRYHWRDPKENEAFQLALNGFASHFPLEDRPDLVAHAEYLYKGCVGCIGVLHDWLADALDVAIADNASTLTLDHLKQTRPDDDGLRRLEEETTKGERGFLDLKEKCRESSDGLLAAESEWVERLREEDAAKEQPPQKESKQRKPPQSRKAVNRARPRPGRMKPQKVPIGGAIARMPK